MPEITVTDYDGLEIDAESRAVTVTLYDGQPAHDLPTGGTTNQVLAKASDADYDVAWVDDGVGGGGSLVTVAADGTVTVDGSGVELATGAQLAAHAHDDRYYTETEVDTALASNATADRARANHTGTQTSATISDFDEAVQDAVAALLSAGTAISLSYDDAGNSLTITGTGGSGGLDAEAVRDAIGVALIGSGLISVTVNDAADTITISTTATANSTDAQLRDRSTHTGTQAATTITGLATVATSGAYADLSGKPAIPDSADDIGAASAADLTAHLNDTTDAHDAAAISFSPTGTIAATDVQAAIAEVAAEATGGGGASDAADVTFTPTGTIAATNVQDAIAEVASEAAGGGSAWALSVSNPLTSTTGLTVGNGTWSASGSGLRQTNNGNGQTRISFDTNYPTSLIITEAKITVHSMSASNGRVGFLFGLPSTNGTGADSLFITAGNIDTSALRTVYAEQDAVLGGATESLSAAINNGTEFTLRVVKSGLHMSVYVNGTFVVTLRSPTSSFVSHKRVGLHAHLADATFRDFKLWLPTLP